MGSKTLSVGSLYYVVGGIYYPSASLHLGVVPSAKFRRIFVSTGVGGFRIFGEISSKFRHFVRQSATFVCITFAQYCWYCKIIARRNHCQDKPVFHPVWKGGGVG